MKKIMLIIVVMFACKIYSQQAEKVLIYNGDELKIWVHTKSIVKEEEYVTYWSEWEYITQKSRNEIINREINYIKKYEDYKDIDFVKWARFKSIKEQVCIDITDRTYNPIQYIHYTNTGEILNTYKKEKATWDDVVPGSVFEVEYDYVKKYAETKLK